MSDPEQVPAAVGVVGSGAESLADLVAAAGGDPLVGDANRVAAAGVDVAVAVGRGAARDLAVGAPGLPVLAVDAPGLPSVPRASFPDALDSLLAGEWTARDCSLLEVVADGETASALLDVTLMTREPARISEYAVESGTEAVESFRADGVVVATAAGSHGYARNAGGPTLSPPIDGAVVVPIAPFAIDQDRWVLDYPLSLSVERDECPVELYVDGERRREVDTETPVSVRHDGTATFVRVPERTPRFG
jgi:NAD+ kinase